MRKLAILALLGIVISFNTVTAQVKGKGKKVYDFTAVEKQPSYPGGIAKFYEYLGKNIKYPEVAKKNKTEGKVFLSFIVEEDGSLSAIEVLKGLSKETDAEAVRVFKAAPKWNPALVKGKPVRVKYNINVNFADPNGKQTQKTSLSPVKAAEYPGGGNSFLSYLAKNLKYPQQAKKDKVEGKVYVSFMIEKNGSLTNIQVLKGLSKETNAEALRVIGTSPKWSPATENGKAFRMKYVMNVKFDLAKS